MTGSTYRVMTGSTYRVMTGSFHIAARLTDPNHYGDGFLTKLTLVCQLRDNLIPIRGTANLPGRIPSDRVIKRNSR